MSLSFAIDTGAGETPESVAKKREIAGLMAARVFSRAPQNVGEGLNAIGQALIARSMMGDADAALQAGLKGGRELYSSAYPGTPSVAAPPAAAAPPSVSTPMGGTSIPAGGQEFTNAVMPLAQAASEKTGIDPRLIVAQAALETGYGKSAPGNNLFGIKSHGQPGGNVLPTTEVVNGQPVRTTDSFAAYASPADSANGYADFINKNPRYAPLKAAQGLEAQAAALGKSGYATDPNYGQKVLSIAQKLPAPQGGILADNSPSPLDNAQYPAGPVGAPTTVAGGPAAPVADDSGATLPPNAQPTGGVLPTAQAVQAATQPQINPRLLQLQQVMGDPRFAFFNKAQQAAVATEYKQLLDQQQQANDPLRQAQIQKAQQDASKSDWEWKPYGRDANGNWTYAWVNSKTQDIKGRDGKPIPATPQPTDDPAAGLMGEDYLKAIPRDRADIARKVANGEIDVSSLPNRGNYRMQVLSDAARFDPTFNPIDYKTRLATRKDFTSGKSAQNITSFNTAIGHLDSLDKSIDKLGNRGSSWYNAATAPISGQVDQKYQIALKDFNTSKQAVIDELTRAFRGSGGNVYDLMEWEKSINATESPAALHAATRRAIELLRSRIEAVGDQYNRGMGKKTDPISLLSPKAQEAMARLEGIGGQPSDASGQRKTSSGVSWSIQ